MARKKTPIALVLAFEQAAEGAFTAQAVRRSGR
jgi:hypothetical protein